VYWRAAFIVEVDVSSYATALTHPDASQITVLAERHVSGRFFGGEAVTASVASCCFQLAGAGGSSGTAADAGGGYRSSRRRGGGRAQCTPSDHVGDGRLQDESSSSTTSAAAAGLYCVHHMSSSLTSSLNTEH